MWHWHQGRSINIGIDHYWATFWINNRILIRHWSVLIDIDHWNSMSCYLKGFAKLELLGEKLQTCHWILCLHKELISRSVFIGHNYYLFHYSEYSISNYIFSFIVRSVLVSSKHLNRNHLRKVFLWSCGERDIYILLQSNKSMVMENGDNKNTMDIIFPRRCLVTLNDTLTKAHGLLQWSLNKITKVRNLFLLEHSSWEQPKPPLYGIKEFDWNFSHKWRDVFV